MTRILNANINHYQRRVEASSTWGSLSTYARWVKFLATHDVSPDNRTLLDLPHPALAVGYTDPGKIVLFYAESPIIEYRADVTVRFIIDPEPVRTYDDSDTVINTHTPDWFHLVYGDGLWWADVTIDDVVRRYPVYYNGEPKTWRRSKLGQKARTQAPAARPTPVNPVSLDTTRDWVNLARIPKDKWLTENLQVIDSIAADASKVVIDADLILAPVRQVRETLLQVGAELRARRPSAPG